METNQFVGTKLWKITGDSVRNFVVIDRVTKTQAIVGDYLRFKLPLEKYNSPIGERYGSHYCLETPEILEIHRKTLALDAAKRNLDDLRLKWLSTEQLEKLNKVLNSFKQ